MIRILDYKEVSKEQILSRAVPAVDVTGIVTDIISQVRTRGDAALREYSERFDKVRLLSLIHI